MLIKNEEIFPTVQILCCNIVVEPLLGNDCETNMFPQQWIHTQEYRNCWKWCFVRSPLQDVMSRTMGASLAVCEEKT